MIDNEIPKYKKSKNSTVSKSSAKSRHKHEYVECLFINDDTPHRGTYCKICGKVGDIQWFETEHTENGLWRVIDYDEVYKMYNNLEKVELDDLLQKYVALSN